MTERDKRIEEMVSIAHPIYGAGYLDIIALGRLVDADYRKADEVRKEAARKFAKLLLKKFDQNCQGHTFYRDDIKRILKKAFGVEVDE